MIQGATEKLLHTARRLFAEHGYEGTSIRQIAQEADVNISMISYYFGGKEQLFERIVEERLGRLADRAKETLHPELDVKDAMLAVVDCYIEEMLDHPDEFRMINRELSRPGRGASSLLVFEKVSRLTAIHLETVKRGVAESRFRSVDLPLVMISIIGLLFHMLNAHTVVRPMLSMQQPKPEGACELCQFTGADKERLRHYVRHLFDNYVFSPVEKSTTATVP